MLVRGSVATDGASRSKPSRDARGQEIGNCAYADGAVTAAEPGIAVRRSPAHNLTVLPERAGVHVACCDCTSVLDARDRDGLKSDGEAADAELIVVIAAPAVDLAAGANHASMSESAGDLALCRRDSVRAGGAARPARPAVGAHPAA